MKAWKRKVAHRRRQQRIETEFFSASEGRELRKMTDSTIRCIQVMNKEVEESHERFMRLAETIEHQRHLIKTYEHYIYLLIISNVAYILLNGR